MCLILIFRRFSSIFLPSPISKQTAAYGRVDHGYSELQTEWTADDAEQQECSHQPGPAPGGNARSLRAAGTSAMFAVG